MANRAQLLRERRKTRQGIKIPRDKLLRFARVLVILGLALGAFFAIPRLIPVDKVICETEEQSCSPNITEKLNQVPPTNLVATKKGLNNVLRNQVSVKNYSIRYQLPASLIVFVIEREPIVAIAREGATSDYAWVDREGVIVGVWDSTDLPIMIVNRESSFQAGQHLPESLMDAVIITSESFKKYNSRLTILKTNYLEVELPSGIHVLFPRDGDLDLLFGSLSLILSNVNSDTIKLLPSIIDLRYKNPVIK